MDANFDYGDGIKGYVAHGYDHVLDEFRTLFLEDHDKRSQLCVYVGEECVINLFRGVSGSQITNIYSSGKSVAAILMAILHDQGLFQYEDAVSKYWPEFAQKGKEGITIQDVMRHEAGMPRLDLMEPFDLSAIGTQGVKDNVIGRAIEQTTPFWPSTGRREYHQTTKDWISNEIFRRVEPQGRTMGEYIRQEIWPLLGENNLLTGASDAELEQNYVDLVVYSGWKTFKDVWNGPDKAYTCIPLRMAMPMYKYYGPIMEKRDSEMRQAGVLGPQECRKIESEAEEFTYEKMEKMTLFHSKFIVKSEMLSAGMAGNAQSLAKLGAFMANRGQLKGKTLIQEQSWENMHSEPKKSQGGGMGLDSTQFTKGGLNFFTPFVKDQHPRPPVILLQDKLLIEGREGYYGWHGYGGSVLQWNTEKKISFAYVPFECNSMDMNNTRGKRLQVAVGRCVAGNAPPQNKKSSTCTVF